MRADLRKPGLDFGAACPLSHLRLGDQGRTLLVRREHGFARRLRPTRHLLVHQAHRKPAGAENCAFVGLEPARDEAEQRRLAAAVAPQQPEPLPRADLRGHALEEEAPINTVSDVLQGQHGRPDICAARARDARAAGAPGCATMAEHQEMKGSAPC